MLKTLMLIMLVAGGKCWIFYDYVGVMLINYFENDMSLFYGFYVLKLIVRLLKER
jgi:hypothetical protein